MRPYNNFINIMVLFFVALFVCGQAPTNKTFVKPKSQDALTIYENMRSPICNCISSTMKNSKPSTTLDSCYHAVLVKYTDTLKSLGYDLSTSDRETEFLLNMIRLDHCQDLYRLLQKEWSDEDVKRLLFKGEFVSQKRLETGEYKIVLRDNKTKVQSTFKAKSPFDESLVKNYLPGYELTVEYEIVKNILTNEDELYIMEHGKVNVVGAVRATNKK